METSVRNRSRLYAQYVRYIERLRQDIIRINHSWGSTKNDTRLRPLSREQFDAVLDSPKSDPEVIRLWIRRIVAGQDQDAAAA